MQPKVSAVITVMKNKLISFVLYRLDRVFDTDYSIKYHNARIGFHTNSYRFKSTEVCFIHIPKTAGTSIATTFELLNAAGAGLGPNYKKHIPVSASCPTHSYRYVTSMRIPVDRVWSYYQMAIRETKNPYHAYSSRGLKYFLEHCWECRDMMTKYLIGDIRDIANPAPDLIAKAVDNLSNFYFVFDFENLEKSNTDFIQKVKKDYSIEISFGCNEKSKSMPNLRKFTYQAPSIDEIEIITSFNQCDLKVFNIWRTNFLT